MSHSEAAFNAEAEEEVFENVQPDTFKVPEALMLIQQLPSYQNKNYYCIVSSSGSAVRKSSRTKYTFVFIATAAQ